jgi:hypothetical protein
MQKRIAAGSHDQLVGGLPGRIRWIVSRNPMLSVVGYPSSKGVHARSDPSRAKAHHHIARTIVGCVPIRSSTTIALSPAQTDKEGYHAGAPVNSVKLAIRLGRGQASPGSALRVAVHDVSLRLRQLLGRVRCFTLVRWLGSFERAGARRPCLLARVIFLHRDMRALVSIDLPRHFRYID